MKALTKDYDVTELKMPKYGNKLYIISYCVEGVVGVDYTSNLAEVLDLVNYHEKFSDAFKITSIQKENKW